MTVKTSNILNIVIPIINSVTSVNLKKAGMGSRNNVMKKTKHVVMISFVVVFGLLVFWIFWLIRSFFLEIQRLQPAGSSSTVFAVSFFITFIWRFRLAQT